jgi:uncharacterized protein YacL
VLGAVCGFGLASLASFVLWRAIGAETPTIAFLQIALLAMGAYLGVTLGGAKGFSWTPGSAAVTIPLNDAVKPKFHILDTSVIIDGRIADIAETGFIDRALAIPQFVLGELQLVADSADSLKRNRGRRGLDVLQRLQKMPHITVQILDEDFVHIREVDMKLWSWASF